MMNEIILETKADYFLYIDSIFKHTKYIEYLILEGDKPNTKILEFLKRNHIDSKRVNSWKGTNTNSKESRLFRFDSNLKFKKILLEFDNFFVIDSTKISNSVYSCRIVETDWGKSDIAFYDRNCEIISFIIAHEGDVLVNERYIDGMKHLIIDERITYLYGLG